LFAYGARVAPLHAQQPAAADRVRTVLSPDAAARVDRVATAAGDHGVPAGLVYSKALEGAAKGVPEARLVRGVESYAARLEQASAILGGKAAPPTLAAVADALRRGVPPDAIRAVGRKRSGDLAIPLLVLSELSEAGVPVEHAAAVVSAALDRGERGEGLLRLAASIRGRIREGAPPVQAADAARNVLEAGHGRQRMRRRAAARRLRDAAGPAARPPKGPPVAPGAAPPTRRGADRPKPVDQPAATGSRP